MIEQDIISDVADIYGITSENIVSKRRVRRYSDARAVVCYILHTKCGFSTTEVGRIINRTHPTVLYYSGKVMDWLRMPILNDKGAKIVVELEKRYG